MAFARKKRCEIRGRTSKCVNMSGDPKPKDRKSDSDQRLRRALKILMRENIRLKKLVVSLSESVLRSVTGKKR